MTNSCILSDNVYIGEGIKKPERLLKKLNSKKSVKQYYLVVFNEDFKRIEILNSKIFLQDYFKDKEYIIYGLFSLEDDAFEYIRVITEISYKNYDEFCPYHVLETVSKDEIDKYFGKDE